MLALAGFLTIAVILVLLLTRRIAAVVALAGVPILAALLAGFTPTEVSEAVTTGLTGVAGVTTMFVFAIVYFGVMRDAGLFDPIIRRIVSLAGDTPATVCVATTALACVAHLDGAGATTFLITIPAMMPLFDRLGMSRVTLTACVGMGAGVMNLLPWGGPTARAATTTGTDANELWVPLIPAQVAGVVAALLIAFLLGRKESRRLSRAPETVAAAAGGAGGSAAGSAPGSDAGDASQGPGAGPVTLSAEEAALRRPRLFWFNAALTVVLIGLLVAAVATPEVVFVLGAIVALLVNYPGISQQTARIQAHAEGAMLMASTLLAAGVFLGILDATGMVTAMAESAASVVPDAAGPALPLIVGVLGVPLSLLFGPDAYYFAVLPVLMGVGAEFGVADVDIARASLVGQETVGFPISPLTGSFYLLTGLAGVDIGRHIRHLIGYVWLLSLVMLAVAALTGAVRLWA
ncbi:citrate:proton symporter [uncultured Nocardioides sp.]|uniref:CitMHS family transporter n=1 Tax=uncultured Nocardioides sp. TaxID=198441 RepID=UPI002624F7B3|nr:citrate:proton symporter [uncultured Nocardioides sp.]